MPKHPDKIISYQLYLQLKTVLNYWEDYGYVEDAPFTIDDLLYDTDECIDELEDCKNAQ